MFRLWQDLLFRVRPRDLTAVSELAPSIATSEKCILIKAQNPMFKKDNRDWTEFRKLVPAPMEFDYHPQRGVEDGLSFRERMGAIHGDTIEALRNAQANQEKWLMFVHGRSTSRPGRTSFRSQIRACMRSRDATPYIIRKDCIQHETVFLAAIRPKSAPIRPLVG